MRRLLVLLGMLLLIGGVAGALSARASDDPTAGRIAAAFLPHAAPTATAASEAAGCHRSVAWAQDNIGPGETAAVSGPDAGALCGRLEGQGQLGSVVPAALDAAWPVLCDERWANGTRVAVRWRPTDRPPLSAGMDEAQTDMTFCRTLAGTSGAVAVGDAQPPVWPTVVPVFVSGR